jgi:hypothetical protein
VNQVQFSANFSDTRFIPNHYNLNNLPQRFPIAQGITLDHCNVRIREWFWGGE